MKSINQIISILIVIFLNSCSNNENTSTSNQIDKTNTIKDTICEFPYDTFSYKEFKLGMDISKLTNIKKSPFEFKVASDIEYYVKNANNYSIFNSKVLSITLNVFENKLYAININSDDVGRNLINLFLEKYNIPFDCIQKDNNGDDFSSHLSNKILNVHLMYFDKGFSDMLTNMNKRNNKHSEDIYSKHTFQLSVEDAKIKNLILSKEHEYELKEKEQKLKDF